MLLSRYSNIDYILNLGFNEGYKVIRKAYQKALEDKAWERWLVDYAKMNKENFISFEEYKESLFTVKPIHEAKYLTKEELLKEASEIERKITNRKRGD